MNEHHRKILAIDVGTSAMKAALIDERGNALWYGHEALPAGTDNHHDWQADWWVQALGRLTALLADQTNQTGQPDALVISGHGPSMVLLDSRFEVLGKALLWLDGRQERLPDSRSYYLPKLAWWRSHYPDEWARVRQVVSVPEWLAYCLGGELFTISPHDGFSPHVWTPDEMSRYGFPTSLFPPMIRPAQAMGKVTGRSAAAFGLPAGILLFAGGSDFMMSLAGTGTIRADMTCDRAGSSEGINHCSHLVPARDGLRILPHLVEGLWNVAGILPSSGLMFEWFRNLTGTDRLSYHETLLAINQLPIAGHLPIFRPNAVAPATWDFAEASFTGLKLEHQAIHLIRAVVESIAFSVRSRLEIMEQAGCRVGEIRLCGGQAKNAPWVQMKADITGHELVVPQVKDAELLGNAMMGMIGLGCHRNLEEAVSGMLVEELRVQPDSRRHAEWSLRYQEYIAHIGGA